MKINFKTKTEKISFEDKPTKQGRPPVQTEKADKVKKIFFKASELEELEILYKINNSYNSFSSFLKSLIKKGVQC